MANTTRGTAVAERPADSVWLSALPTPRVTAISDLLPAVHPGAELRQVVRAAGGTLTGLPGAVTDMALSQDGRRLVTAHYGQDAVSVIDTATLTVAATVAGIAEPYAVTAADRAFVRSASISEDSVIAVDLAAGSAIAALEVGVGARGLAVSPAGDVLYVARSSDDAADIAVIDVESGAVDTIVVARAVGASVDTMRINDAGTRLYGALTTAAGGALLVIDLRSRRVVETVAIGGSIDDIAVHRDDHRVFVTGWDAELGGVLRIVDVAVGRVLHTEAVGGLPGQVVVTSVGAYLAVGHEVVVVDTKTSRIVDRIDIGRPVSCLAAGWDEKRLYVGDYDGAVTSLLVQTAGLGLRAAS